MNTDKKDLRAFCRVFLTKISVHPRLFVVNFDLRNTLLEYLIALPPRRRILLYTDNVNSLEFSICNISD